MMACTPRRPRRGLVTIMVENTDWRRQGQDKYLRGRAFRLAPYEPHRTGWDHDHCEFCGRKLGWDEDSVREGYCTSDGYHWVCPECFTDFKAEFEWTVESVEPRLQLDSSTEGD